MANCQRDWDPEGYTDFSDFPIDQSEVNFQQDPIRWPVTWMDEDEGVDFKDQLLKEKEKSTGVAVVKAKPETPKMENHTAKFAWTDGSESVDLKQVIKMVKNIIEDKNGSNP